MRIAQQFRRAALDQAFFHCARGLARRQAGAVPQAEDMRIHRHGILPKGHIQHDIGSLAPNTWQGFQGSSVIRHLPAMAFHKLRGKRRHIARFGLPQPDGADEGPDAFRPQRGHGSGGGGGFE